MSDTNHRPTPDALERATHALRDAPVPPGPPADVRAATTAAVHNRLAGAVPAEVARQQRRRRIMRYVRFGSAATVAAGLLVAAGVLWLGSAPASAAFVKAIENVEKAKSMRAVIVTEAAPEMKFEMKMFVQGDAARSEMDMGKDMGSFVVIVDAKKREMLQLFPRTKTAIRTDLAEVEKKTEAVAKDVGKLTGLLTDLKGAKVAALPDETVDGRKLKVFAVKGHRLEELKGTADVTVWIDPKTELPHRYRMEMQIGDVKTTAVTTFLGFNEDLDPKLFDTTIPEGYKLQGTGPAPAAPKPAPPPAPAKSAGESPAEDATVHISFRTAAENAEKAKSMRAAVALDPGAGPKLEMKLFQQDGRMRAEVATPGLVVIADRASKRGLVLFPEAKTGLRVDLESNALLGKVTADVAGAMNSVRQLKEEKVTALPDEALDGRKLKVYELKGVRQKDLPGEADIKVWIDPDALLPVRTQIRQQQGGQTVSIVMNVLAWNEDLDPTLFDQTPPEGYTITDMKPDAKKDGK